MLKKIKEFIKLKLGIVSLNQRLDYLAALNNVTATEVLSIDKVILKKAIGKLEQDVGKRAIDVKVPIHKNDLMFAFHLYHHSNDPVSALLTYFQIGYKTAQNLKKIVKKHQLKHQTLLDFGSGYGRVSRFFDSFFAETKVVVTDVKDEAMNFQEKSLNYQTIKHGTNPESFPNTKVDLILCLSVFTHLPQKTFVPWLLKLANSLNPSGGLVLTYKEENSKESVFRYYQQSEDEMFSFVSDSLKLEDYGETHVSRKFFEDVFKGQPYSLHFLDNQLAGVQKALLVVNNKLS